MYGLCFPLHVVMSGQLSECRDLSSPMGTCGMVGTASQRTCADICWPLVLGVGLHRGSVLLTFSDLLGFPASGLHGSFCVPHVSAAAFIPSDSLGPSCAPLEHRVTCGCSCLMLRLLGKPEGSVKPLCTWVQVKLDAVPRLSQKWGPLWYSCFLKVLVEAAQPSSQVLRC